MRELLRVGLRFIMILFLVVGCVHNAYYMGELAKNNEYERYRDNYKPIHYDDDIDDVDDEYVSDRNVDTVKTETEDVPYPDYNRGISAVRPY